MNSLAQSLAGNMTRTENGAETFKQTGSAVLDFFYHAAARRNQNNTALFASAYAENAQLAVLALFYVRDIRGGQGERKTFRDCLAWLERNDSAMFDRILPFVPMYGRWDDMLMLVNNRSVRTMVARQLKEDSLVDKPSLLGKWMPSNNTSSGATRGLASRWEGALALTPRAYRKMLTSLRTKLRIVESTMSRREFSTIEYDKLPSKAGYKYRKAFGKRDGVRYSAFIESVKRGEKKINASTLYPYEIVAQCMHKSKDDTLEVMWKALPDYCNGKSFITVADVSGSMMSGYPGNPVPLHVALSLAVYGAERNKGAFKDIWITFSENAKANKLKGSTLHERIRTMDTSGWGMSTDLQAVFKLLLDTAKRVNSPQSDMPETIFIVSDVEFNACVKGSTNFESAKRAFDSAGYTLPSVVFWNVNSKNTQTPVTMHTSGVMLVSGCSPSIFKYALSGKISNPYDMMLEVLNADRYRPIAESMW